jgi:hypothetical protein
MPEELAWERAIEILVSEEKEPQRLIYIRDENCEPDQVFISSNPKDFIIHIARELVAGKIDKDYIRINALLQTLTHCIEECSDKCFLFFNDINCLSEYSRSVNLCLADIEIIRDRYQTAKAEEEARWQDELKFVFGSDVEFDSEDDSEEEAKEDCCVCLETCEKFSWTCRTCKSGLVCRCCKKKWEKLKNAQSAEVS